MPIAEYARIRREHRRKLVDVKQKRRVHIGPSITLYFENYDTMLHQVHEMLFIEKGGEEQIADELSAYNPLIPKGSELVATVMLEIEDPERRARTELRSFEQAWRDGRRYWWVEQRLPDGCLAVTGVDITGQARPRPAG